MTPWRRPNVTPGLHSLDKKWMEAIWFAAQLQFRDDLRRDLELAERMARANLGLYRPL